MHWTSVGLFDRGWSVEKILQRHAESIGRSAVCSFGWPRLLAISRGKLQKSVKKREEEKDWEDGHPKMSPNQLSRKEKNTDETSWVASWALNITPTTHGEVPTVTVSSDCVRILVGTKRGKKRTKEKKNAEQLSEWKRDQSSSMDGAELSYKARNMPWLSEIELTSGFVGVDH